MATHERSDEERAKIVAAGHAAASWVRARRATWTDVPLPKPRAAVSHAPVIEPPATIFKEAPATLFKEAPAPVEPDEPGMAERAGEWVESAKGPIAQWLPRMAMAAAAVAVVFFGGRGGGDGRAGCGGCGIASGTSVQVARRARTQLAAAWPAATILACRSADRSRVATDKNYNRSPVQR